MSHALEINRCTQLDSSLSLIRHYAESTVQGFFYISPAGGCVGGCVGTVRGKKCGKALGMNRNHGNQAGGRDGGDIQARGFQMGERGSRQIGQKLELRILEWIGSGYRRLKVFH